MPDLVKELQRKTEQLEEQLQLAVKEYPNRSALERLKFAMALARFMRTELHMAASQQRLNDDPDATVDQPA